MVNKNAKVNRSREEKIMANLEIKFCGLRLENPFVLAPTPSTDELEMARNGLSAGWAGIILKTTHSEDLIVKPVSPILWGYDFEDKKMVGLGNIDLVSRYPVGIVEGRVRDLKKEFPNKLVIAAIVGEDRDTLQSLTKRLITAGADAIECSAGCPQDRGDLEPGGLLQEELRLLGETVNWVKEAAGSVPVFVKLEEVGHADIVQLAQTAKAAGADAVLAGGLALGIMGVDLDTYVPYPSVNGKSTYSAYTGPVLKPISLKNVCQVAKCVNIPVMSGGGIMTWRDALEVMLLGATVVEVGTAVMRNGFRIIEDLIDGVKVYLEERNIPNVSDLVGKALPNVVTQFELSREYQMVPLINPETCIKDDLCYISCRDGGHMAIELGEDRIPRVDEEKCVGCGLCQVVCPVSNCVIMKPKVK